MEALLEPGKKKEQSEDRADVEHHEDEACAYAGWHALLVPGVGQSTLRPALGVRPCLAAALAVSLRAQREHESGVRGAFRPNFWLTTCRSVMSSLRAGYVFAAAPLTGVCACAVRPARHLFRDDAGGPPQRVPSAPRTEVAHIQALTCA